MQLQELSSCTGVCEDAKESVSSQQSLFLSQLVVQSVSGFTHWTTYCSQPAASGMAAGWQENIPKLQLHETPTKEGRVVVLDLYF